VLWVVGGISLPLTSFALARSYVVQMPPIWPRGFWGPILNFCSGIACSAWGLCGIVQVILNVISFGISIAFFAVLPIFLTWGGVVILTSQGNPGKLGEGKKILTGTLVGALITLGGYLIVKTFVGFLNIGGIGGFNSGFLGCS
jgi:hypothetical protein